MNMTASRNPRQQKALNGFTLIELLVVVSIIALLVSILLPSLNKAREMAKAAKCLMNLKSVGQGMATYTAENDVFPPSYVYPRTESGNWSVADQYLGAPKPAGIYMHWSHFLMESGGKTNSEAFECPSQRNGGAPRTNPGDEADDWGPNDSGLVQVDDGGSTTPSAREDLQAPRMAYTANAALVPRNKLTPGNGTYRYDRFVKSSSVRQNGAVILASEFTNNWVNIGYRSGNQLLVKSHRPVSAFTLIVSKVTGDEIYQNSSTSSPFSYGDPGSQGSDFGLMTMEELNNPQTGAGLFYGSSFNHSCEVNVIGRHHPGSSDLGDEYGGTANFLYCDGHAERKHIFDTMIKREWGEKFYTLAGGNNDVRSFYQ